MRRHKLFFIVLLVMGIVPAGADQGADPAVFGQDEWMLGAAAVEDEQLDRSRGRQTVFNSNDVDGELYGNAAVSNVTGSNFVTDGSFAGMSGFSTVIQNSGNNVLIQSATVLNLQFQ